MAQHFRLQPGEPVAEVNSARRNRGLVYDQSAVTVYQVRRAVGEARAVLLAMLAEGHLTRAWFAAMLQRIETLALAEISGSRRLIVLQEIQNDLGSHRRIAWLVGFRLISGEFVCSTGIGCQDVDVRHGGNIDVEVLQNKHRSVRPMVYIG